MLYCDKCQVLSSDDQTCPLCGSQELRSPAEDDPVLLITAGAEEAEQIAAAFDDEGIPHMERFLGGGGVSSVILGQSRCAQVRIFVPFGTIHHAADMMRGIGVLKDFGENGVRPESAVQNAKSGKQEVPMSHGRRTAVRIFSALLFLILVIAVVSGADTIANLFKSVFH